MIHCDILTVVVSTASINDHCCGSDYGCAYYIVKITGVHARGRACIVVVKACRALLVFR